MVFSTLLRSRLGLVTLMKLEPRLPQTATATRYPGEQPRAPRVQAHPPREPPKTTRPNQRQSPPHATSCHHHGYRAGRLRLCHQNGVGRGQRSNRHLRSQDEDTLARQRDCGFVCSVRSVLITSLTPHRSQSCLPRRPNPRSSPMKSISPSSPPLTPTLRDRANAGTAG